MSDLSSDPRWQRFNDRSFSCPCCGQSFGGLFDVSFDHPHEWPHGNRSASGQDTLVSGRDRLTSDFCVFDDEYYIRCVMPLPIKGAEQTFAFGVWGSVTRENFKAYAAGFETDDYGDFEGCFAWLGNMLPCVGQDDWVPCDLLIEDPTQRPVLYAHEAGGSVRRYQDEGISFDRLLDIYAASGQDIRPHLMDA